MINDGDIIKKMANIKSTVGKQCYVMKSLGLNILSNNNLVKLFYI